MRFRGILAVFPAMALLFARAAAQAQSAPDLGDAASFVVLGHSSVVNTGTATRITGNVGVSPSERIEGLTKDMFVVGDIRANDALAKSARRDSDAADAFLADLAGRPCDSTLAATELGGMTFTHGVYCFTATDVRLNGIVTFNAEGNRDAVFILRFAGALTTGSGALVLVIGNGYDGNVFWRTNGAVNIGANASFIGNVFAGTGIMFGSGARISGRALTRTGSVVLNNNLVLLCCAPITVNPASVPNGTLGVEYEQKFSASGGLTSYTFTISAGSLPPGLTLSSSGVLEGTPRETGRFPFTITATDSLGCTGSAAYVIKIACGIVTELEPGTVGVDYEKKLFPGGTCTLKAGTFPRDVELLGCTVGGRPASPGTFRFVVKNGGVEHCYTLTIADCPIVFTSVAPPAGFACTPYEHAFIAECTTPKHQFTATGLPEELVLSKDGKLSGTVKSKGAPMIAVTVTDALRRSHTETYTLKFECPPNPPEVIVLPPGKVGVPYDEQIPSLTCSDAKDFSVPTPPAWADVSSGGRVTGTPSKVETRSFEVVFTSLDGCTVTGTVSVTIGIDCPPITFSDLPPMAQGVAYDQTIEVDGVGPNIKVDAENLPEGISHDGLRIHGTPLAPGPYEFTIAVTDLDTMCFERRDYSLNCPTLSIAPDALPDGVEGAVYGPLAFSTSGGTPPYVYSISAGALPAGIVLTGDTLSGTPTVSGPFFFTVSVTDVYGCTGTREYSIYVVCTVACPPGVPTLSEWMSMLLAIAIAAAGLRILGGQRP